MTSPTDKELAELLVAAKAAMLKRTANRRRTKSDCEIMALLHLAADRLARDG